MSKKGNDFILKEGDGEETESFATIAGLRGTSFAINGETVDMTSKDSGGFRELLDGGGLKTLSITADGVYLGPDEEEQTNLRDRATDGSLNNYQLDDGEETIEGAFQVVSFEQDGPMNEGQTFSVTLESSGEWSVAAVA
ncbi:MAG TPA: phage major tail protein, TP901-1 family [Longimicrobiales bacterium]|nr:phage major tail protein, TP901-1 family [Longimicrobiales bacterium]